MCKFVLWKGFICMILPPKKPIGNQLSYFDILCEKAQPFIPEVALVFTGFDDLVDRYVMLSDLDSSGNVEMAIEFNAWSEYFSEISNVIQNQYLDSETDKLQTFSAASIAFSEKNVSAGDRKANTNADVIIARKKRNALKSLYDALEAKKEFCDKVFYQCKHNCIEMSEKAAANARK